MELPFLICLIILVGAVSSASVSSGSNTPGCENKQVDLYFVLDSSSSVWIVNFDKMLQFVLSIVQRLTISPNDSRVGLGAFSDSFLQIFGLNDYTNQTILQRAVLGTPHMSGITNTAKGINGMRTLGFAANVVRPGVPRVAVVVFDGMSHYRSQTVAEARAAHDDGVLIMAIGMGSVDPEELNAIASEPKADYAFHIPSPNSLNSTIPKLLNNICQMEVLPADNADCGLTKKADVMFVYNAAGMNFYEVTSVRNFIRDVAGQINMNSGNIRVGVVSEGCQRGDIKLNQYSQRDHFVSGLLDLPQPELSPLLKRLRSNGFLDSNGGRQNAVKMAVVFLEDVLTLRDNVALESFLLKRDGVSIHVVRVGSRATKEDAKLIASNSSLITEVSSFDQLKDTSLQQTFLRRFCEKL